jgi:hypothetical protein
VASVELDELGNGDDITTCTNAIHGVNTELGGVHIAFQLEVAALIFAILTAITLVIRGIIITTVSINGQLRALRPSR